MDKNALIAINKWNYFIYNFPSNFIEQVWADDPSLAAHFRGKFNYYEKQYGGYGCIPALYGELGNNNRKKLMQWVMDNFNDEQRLYFKEEEE